jgi:hypothetical protein
MERRPINSESDAEKGEERQGFQEQQTSLAKSAKTHLAPGSAAQAPVRDEQPWQQGQEEQRVNESQLKPSEKLLGSLQYRTFDGQKEPGVEQGPQPLGQSQHLEARRSTTKPAQQRTTPQPPLLSQNYLRQKQLVKSVSLPILRSAVKVLTTSKIRPKGHKPGLTQEYPNKDSKISTSSTTVE